MVPNVMVQVFIPAGYVTSNLTTLPGLIVTPPVGVNVPPAFMVITLD